MPTLPLVLACAVVGLLLWAPAGFAFARRLFPTRILALAAAPLLGWAIQNALALAVSRTFGFSLATVLGASALAILLGLLLPGRAMRAQDGLADGSGGAPLLPLLLLAGAAALIALGPAAAVLPKSSGDQVALAAPIYDHAKAALIDEIMTSGMPPANPVYGAGGGPGRVAYYYLWHFGAAQTGLLAGATGWTADIASSWFSAFATLLLVAGLAFHLSGGRAVAPAFALAAAAAGNARPLIEAALGPHSVNALIASPVGFGGFLFQSSWSPHHVAAAASAVLATWLTARLARGVDARGVVALGLVLAAGFQASLWVGGIVVALAGVAIASTLLVHMEDRRRGAFLLGLALAGLVALAFCAPLLMEQIHAASARGGGAPVRLSPFPVLMPAFGDESVRRLLDIPAFAVFLLLELPAVVPAGLLALAGLLRTRDRTGHDQYLPQALAALILVSIASSALLMSTAGENNDLGWRAILPAVLALAACAGAGVARWLDQDARARLMASLVLLALALPASIWLVTANARGNPSKDGRTFARDPIMWEAVRRSVPPTERLASNPDRLGALTAWPVNASWALLARRRSCYGGDEMALAFAPLTTAERAAAAALFKKVFSGDGTGADVTALRRDFGCAWALVTAEDGAFRADPFATDPSYRLEAEDDGRWRLYRAVAPGAEQTPVPGRR